MPVQTLPYHSLIEINRTSVTPVYQQVADGLTSLIKEEKLKQGSPLPSSRELASVLKLNRTTIMAAYEELSSQAWIQVLPRKGVFVSKILPELRPVSFQQLDNHLPTRPQNSFYMRITDVRPSVVSYRQSYELVINDGYPDERIAPLEMIASHYKTLLSKHYKHTALINEEAAGAASLRNELSNFLSITRGLNVTPDHILTTRGAQGAIYIAAQMVVKPGSRVIVGNLNYSMANKVFRQLGATLVKVQVDEEGIDVDAIEAICKENRPDLLYIVPHHHHPTTVTLSAERRSKLLNLIQAYQLPVIEDDYDYDFHYDKSPILPLASTDHKGLVLYIGSISKTLSLTIRSGYLVASTDFIWQASKLKELMELRSDYLMEDSIAFIFKSGEMQRHIARSVKLYEGRRDLLCFLLMEQLKDVIHFNLPLGGMALWARFDLKFPLPQITKQLTKQGIYLNDGSLYNQGDPSVNSVRIGFASVNDNEIEKFVRALFLSL